MNKPQPRIAQEHTDKIFALAAELQAKHEQSYSLAELKQIGAEANISPEFIERATKQIQSKKKRESRLDLILESLSNEYLSLACYLIFVSKLSRKHLTL